MRTDHEKRLSALGRAFAQVASVALLGACGGGSSGGSGGEAPAPAPAISTAPAPARGPSPSPSPGPAPAPSHAVTLAVAGEGRVSSHPSGIDCGTDCHEAYPQGTSVTLTATPATGFHVEAWGGGHCSGDAPTCTLTVAAARNVTVSFAADAGSTASVDEIIAAMPANSWKALPGTQMKDVCPQPYQRYFCENVIAAWSGGAYDDRRDRMVIYGGGHSDSWYNNVFVFDLGPMRWQRLSEMSGGATGTSPGAGWNDSRIETCAFYPKGPLSLPDSVMNGAYVAYDKCYVEPVLSQLDLQQPRSTHSYGKVFVDRINDRYCYLGGSYYPGAQTSSPATVCFDPSTRLWQRIADRPANVGGRGQTALAADGSVWYLTAEGGPVAEYRPGANTWHTYGYVNFEAGGGADIDRTRHHYYSLVRKPSGEHVLRRWNIGSPESLAQRPAFAEFAGSGEVPTNLGTRPGFAYADARDRFFAWGGGRNVYVFDPASERWTLVAASGDDPGPQQTWGTYGRFRYSAARDVFVLVNSTTQNVFVFKPGR